MQQAEEGEQVHTPVVLAPKIHVHGVTGKEIGTCMSKPIRKYVPPVYIS